MKPKTAEQLAQAVKAQHQPKPMATGHLGEVREYCTDDPFRRWPCIEYQLAMVVLGEEVNTTEKDGS